MGFRYKIALLNELRNRRRSIITLLSIQVAVVSLVLFGGSVASMYEGMRENMIRSQLGHIQIYKQGFNQYGHIEPETYLLNQGDVKKIIAGKKEIMLNELRNKQHFTRLRSCEVKITLNGRLV